MRERTLFARTGTTLTVSLTVFALFALAVMAYYVVFPVARRAADDLAALMVLSAQTWVELPPQTRADFEWELNHNHALRFADPQVKLPVMEHPWPYLRFLQQAIEQRVGFSVPLHVTEEPQRWYWVDIPMAGRTIRIGFDADRLGTHPPTAILLVVFGGALAVVLTTLLVVRRTTRPLARLAEAAQRIGSGQFGQRLPERGPAELAALERAFNRMASELQQLLNNRTTLLAGISHDLRTPLTRMRLALELLRDQTEPELLSGLERDLEQMDQLIGQALELGRGPQTQDAQPVALETLIEEAAQDAARAGAEVQWRVHGDCVCRVAPGAMRRVLTNLLNNAVRYGGDRPVELQCECAGGEGVLRVLDRGPGIPEEQRESVFLPFHRLEQSRSRDTGGSGLGLAIVRQLCESHGWTVTLEARPGGGTEAVLRFPCSDMSAAP